MYNEFPNHEPSDIENNGWNGCSFERLEIVGVPNPSTHMLPESNADFLILVDVPQLALYFQTPF
jgi:hypothetical protein